MISSNRILAIDGLRAVAVLSVILYHLQETLLPGGFAGVDVFFVISGYVVTRAIAQRVDSPWHSYLKDFYVRRILRIFPALLVCLLVTLIAEAVLVPQSWLSSQNFNTAKYAFFGLSNVFLSTNQESYFSPRIEFNPYVHTWSLGVEEQFYVLLPLLYLAQRRLAAGGIRSLVRWALPILCLVSLGLSAHYSANDPSQAYYALASRFWELGLGACLFELHRTRGTQPYTWPAARRAMLAASWTLLALGLWLSDKRHFPVPYAALSVLGTLGLIDLAARRAWSLGASGAGRIVVYVGTISYSLYLWHWPVFTIARWTTGLADGTSKLLAVATVALLAVASFHMIEQPFQRRWFYVQKRLLVLAVGVVAIVSGALAAKGIDATRSQLTWSVTGDQHAWYPYDWSSSNTATGCHGASQTEVHDGYRRILKQREGCGDRGPERTIFVAGDSHAGAYESMLGRLAKERPYAVEIYLMSGCPFFILSRPVSSHSAECQDFVRATLGRIASTARPGDVLFLPSRRMRPYANQWGEATTEGPAAPSPSQRDSLVRETTALLAPVIDKGVHIVVEAPKPVFPSPAFRCSDWFNRGNPVCAGGLVVDAAVLQERRRPMMTVLHQLQSARPAIRIWDPFPILCPGDACRAVDNGLPLFFDGDHLSADGNERLFSSFDHFVESAARQISPR